MKFSSQEELGLRCLIQVARHPNQDRGITIQEIAESEGITVHNVAKLLRLLRIGGFIDSTRGQVGGYFLARPASEIVVNDILSTLGGRLYESNFCERFNEENEPCNHKFDCSVRSLWQKIQNAVDQVVKNITLEDLIRENNQPKPVEISEFKLNRLA
ncbi:MAG: Rrf2 family transcriptional regulator [Bacteroidetes bacterium]|nr:Rrf2 family transcriptional regulator [Bacteroidota bacterium]